MLNKIIDHSFIIAKCLFQGILIAYLVFSSNYQLTTAGLLFLYCALFFSLSVSYELISSYKNVILLLEGVLLFILYLFYPDECAILLPFLIMDVITLLQFNRLWYLTSYLSLLISDNNLVLYFFLITFFLWIYYENHIVVSFYKKEVSENAILELELKNHMDQRETHYKEELSKNELTYENQYLEDKAHLSQELHDKLGHNINGSVYQLEACKVLLKKDPEKCIEMIQNVINTLRTGMDAIRLLLRNERPDKKRLAVLQLNTLCQECIEKYGIDTQLNIDLQQKELPEVIWDILLDNTFEAISNALKYSKCTKLEIQIVVMNKLVRCCISDNGIGCSQLTDGMGIQGIRKRMRSVNGYLDFETEHGFTINMLIPLNERKDDL